MKEKNLKISADALKWVALITMFIDHIGAGILEKNYPELSTVDIVIRCIGRIAFPIFCFLLVEGFVYTRNRWKYALNLLIFAIISEVPFDFLFKGELTLGYQNVYLTLLVGLLALMLIDYIDRQEWRFGKVLSILAAAGCAVVAELMHTDYGMWGVMLIEVIYFTRTMSKNWSFVCRSLFLCTVVSEIPGIIAFVLILFYSGERKNKINKYVFYGLYPIHITLYLGIRYLLEVLGI